MVSSKNLFPGDVPRKRGPAEAQLAAKPQRLERATRPRSGRSILNTSGYDGIIMGMYMYNIYIIIIIIITIMIIIIYIYIHNVHS